MRLSRRFYLVTAIGAAVAVIALDQISKFFLATEVLNVGISFGLAADWQKLSLLSLTLTLTLALWIGRKAWQESWPWWGWLGWSGVVGGGLSNALDRFLYGAVRDPLPLPLPGFPLNNNLADYAIFLGVCFTIGAVHWRQRKKDL